MPKPSGGASASAAPLNTPCRARGAEMAFKVNAFATQQIFTFLQVCNAPAQVQIVLQALSVPGNPAQIIFPAADISNGPNPIQTALAGLPVGLYQVIWQYVTTGPFEIVAEILVDGIAHFRKLNTYKDALPKFGISVVIQIF